MQFSLKSMEKVLKEMNYRERRFLVPKKDIADGKVENKEAKAKVRTEASPER